MFLHNNKVRLTEQAAQLFAEISSFDTLPAYISKREVGKVQARRIQRDKLIEVEVLFESGDVIKINPELLDDLG